MNNYVIHIKANGVDYFLTRKKIITLRPKIREFDTKYKIPLITIVTKNLPDGEHRGRVLFTIDIYDQSNV